MPTRDAPTAKVVLESRDEWTNKHENVTQRIAGIYDVWNPNIDDKLAAYNATTTAMQSLIREAVNDRARLRAFGGGWSLSRVGVTDGYLINTKPLRLRFTVNSASVSQDYAGDRKNLRLVQCGNSITRLNRAFAAEKVSLKASGSNNGQTIVGGMSTGTHGAGIDVGALQDFVVGLHVIVGQGDHVWLERQSYPVVGQRLVNKLGARLIQDDTLFNAVLVSFGSFGIIHGVMIETEPRFLLEAHRIRMDFDEGLRRAMTGYDFSDPRFPNPGERPYHFEVTFNPNEDRMRGLVQIMYKRPYRSNYVPPDRDIDEPGLGDNALSVIGRILDLGIVPGGLTRSFLNSSIEDEFELYGPRFGMLGEIFSAEWVRGTSLAAGMGVHQEHVERALEAAFAAYREQDEVQAVLISYRFVRKSDALLAFTRFDPGCVLEIDAIASDGANEVLHRVWRNLEAEAIPYTVHWGKFNKFDAAQVRGMYGGAVDQWIQSREQLLDAPTRAVFSSPFLETIGLAT